MRTSRGGSAPARFAAPPVLVLLGPLLVGTCMASCIVKGIDEATFTSKMTVRQDVAPISHLLVALTGGLDDDWRQGMRSGLTHQLASCGIRSMTMSPSGLEFDFLGRARRAAQQARVSAMLTIECKHSSTFDLKYETKTQLTFELIMIEPRSGKVIWLVESKLDLTGNVNTSDFASAEQFAASIVSRLRTDGVLPTCLRPPSKGPPARQHRVAAQAMCSRVHCESVVHGPVDGASGMVSPLTVQ